MRIIVGVLTVLAALFFISSSVSAEEHLDQEPDWARKPTAEEIQRYYPPLAALLAVSGRATLVCQVTEQGDLEACNTEDASPVGFAFDTAAVAMSVAFRMSPGAVSGRTARSEVRIPIRFQTPLDMLAKLAGPRPKVNAAALAQARHYVDEANWAAGTFQGAYRLSLQIETSSLPNDATTNIRKAAVEAIRGVAADITEDVATEYAYAFADVFNARELADMRVQVSTQGGQVMLNVGPIAAAATAAASRRALPLSRSIARRLFCERRSCEIEQTEAGHDAGARIPNAQDWAQTPPASAVKAAAPRLAEPLGLALRARLVCRIGPLGELVDCQSQEASPSGLGVAEAALSLTKFYRLTVEKSGAFTPGQNVTVVVDFPTLNIPPRSPPPVEASRRLDLARQVAPFASTQRFEVEESERVVLAGGTGRPDPYVLADAITAIEQSRRLATEESSETAARQLALMLSEADLATAVRSSESLGGKAYLLRRPELAKAGFLAQRRAQLVLIRAARSRLCATVSCEITDYAGATSDPSTAKP